MYFTAKVEDGCIKIPEELLIFFETGDEVAVATSGLGIGVANSRDEMAMHDRYALTDAERRDLERKIVATEARKRTIDDMRAFFNAIELDPEDAKYDREELHRRGTSLS